MINSPAGETRAGVQLTAVRIVMIGTGTSYGSNSPGRITPRRAFCVFNPQPTR
jgi:hypothetical protein